MVSTRHWVGGALAALLIALFFGLAAALVTAPPAHALEEGVYELDAKVLKAGSDDLSVADASIAEPVLMVVRDGAAYLEAQIVPVTTAGLTGYLGFLGYFPTYHESTAPNGLEAKVACPQSSYETVDEFNAQQGSDVAVAGLEYPKSTVIELDQNYSELWIEVYVPLVESLNSGSGSQFARLEIDYGTARSLEDAEAIAAAQDAVDSYLQAEFSGYHALYAKLVQTRMQLLQQARESASESEDATGDSKSESSSKNSGSASKASDTASGKTSSKKATKLDLAKLPDGLYTIYGEMIKTDRRSQSISNNAIGHNVRIRVKNGRYTLELTFKSMVVSGKTGALGKLWYFKSGYSKSGSGVPEGATARAKVLSYLALGDGATYPKKLRFPLIAEARSDGWVPLRVFVPIIESISKGAGVQEVYLKLDEDTLVSGAKDVASSTTSGSASGSTVSAAASGSSASGASATESENDESIDALLGDVEDEDADSDKDSGSEDDEGAEADSGDSAGAGEAASSASQEAQDPPLRRYIGLIIGIPALIVCLYCLYVLYSRRGRFRGAKKGAASLVLFSVLLLALGFCPQAQAVTGSVYSGTLERCYRHPVTGVIEDSGGEAGRATGQGMIEGCLSKKTMLEVTDSGQYFLTIRLSLIDYTSDRDFKVQKWGAKKWRATKFAITKKGEVNGETAYDYCIRVPSQKCVVRMTMFVKPIGREVVCYFYPTKLKLGKQSGMNAKIVTGSSKKGKGKKSLETQDAKTNDTDASSDSETPEAGTAVGAAQGLTLSVAEEAGAGQDGAQKTQLSLPSLDDSRLRMVAGALAGAVVLAAVVFALLLARRRRARRAAWGADEYAQAYEQSKSGAGPRENGGLQ